MDSDTNSFSIPRTYSLPWTEHERIRREARERFDNNYSARLLDLITKGRAKEAEENDKPPEAA